MKVLGITIEGKNCILLVLNYESGNFELVKTIPKIEVNNPDDQTELKDFYTNISAFTKDQFIDKVFIKHKNKKGDFAGGADGFKLEAIIQLLDKDVVLLSPNTITSKMKKIDINQYESIINKYQIDALKTAITGCLKKC